jgi:hypothetical protein
LSCAEWRQWNEVSAEGSIGRLPLDDDLALMLEEVHERRKG